MGFKGNMQHMSYVGRLSWAVEIILNRYPMRSLLYCLVFLDQISFANKTADLCMRFQYRFHNLPSGFSAAGELYLRIYAPELQQP